MTLTEPAPSDAPAPFAPSFWHLINTRRSIRRYQATPVAHEVLEALLRAAQWAPSAHNRQPWRFCVVTSASVKAALSQRMGEQWRAELAADNVGLDAVERRIAISHARLTGAPALIVPALSMQEMDVYPDAVRQEAEWTMAVQSVALACQNLLLAAHHVGLGACWLCAPLFVSVLVREVLGLPEEWQPQALITVGYPAAEKTKDRLPLANSVIWR